MVVNPSRATAADKPVVVVLRQGGRRYPGNSGGPGNGGGKSNCAAAFLPATPEAQVTVVVNPSRATAADKPVVVVLRQGGRRYPGNSGGPGNGGGKSNCAAAFLPGNSGGPGNGGGKSNCAAAFLPATPEAQVTVVVNPSRATAADKPVVVVLRQGGRRYPGNSGGPGNGGGIQAGKNGQAAGKSN